MGQLVTTGATLVCSMGMGVSALNVTSQHMTLADGKPVATIQDAVSMTNIPSFGMCTSLANCHGCTDTAALCPPDYRFMDSKPDNGNCGRKTMPHKRL